MKHPDPAALLVASFLAAALPFAALPLADDPNPVVDRLLDRIVARERIFLDSIRKRTPLIETYIQELPEAAREDARPIRDQYFLGRFRLGETVAYEALVDRSDPAPKKSRSRAKNQPLTFLPRGFAQMSVIDLRDFNRETYRFDYAGREFLGDVRCLVFDIGPKNRAQPGKFVGRVWVEDRDDSIVRFNGTYGGAYEGPYAQAPAPKDAAPERYFHFDSWRVNIAPQEWVPAQIYVEEEAAPGDAASPRFKAQTRIWDYAAAPLNKLDELTNILIESETHVNDQTASKDLSPLESQRAWEKQAEDNLLGSLEKAGLLAPPGPVDEVLNTVVNNLIVSSNLNLDVHCRVLLTTPIETFSIGRTIVISRGLIDVLPDETSLAMVLADELSHVALGHATETRFAFHNQTMLTDGELLQRLHLQRPPEETDAAGQKTLEIMRASPYQKTASAGLFLKALAGLETALPRLLQTNLGNQAANPEALARLAEFAPAPAIEDAKLEQIAALPLGSRVKVNPWNDQITLVKARPISLLSPREKMPFEVTPFVLYLTRVDAGGPSAAHAP